MSNATRLAFVAGATGYTGRAVVAALRARGVRTVAHVRPDSAEVEAWRARFAALGAEVSTAPWEAEALGAALAALGVTEVYGLVGTTRARAKALGRDGGAGAAAAASYDAVDYGLTALLAGAARASGRAPWLVYLSSLGADAASRNPYLRARGRAEEAVRAAGVPFTIIRPSFVSGPDRPESRPAERAGAVLGDGVLGLARLFGARSFAARYRSVSAEALAALLIALPGDPAREGATLTLDALRA